MANWYLGSTKWTAITAWAASTAYIVGDIRRQLAAPAVGSERAFRCTTAGTSGTAEPTWTLTKASTTADATVVWTEVTGDNAYGWTAAHARLANTFAWMAGGDTCYVSNNHAETQSTAISLTSPGTAASPCTVLCVTDTATPPTAVAATATISTTGVNSNIGFLTGVAYVYGVTFSAGAAASEADINMTNVSAWTFESCVLKFNNSSGNSILTLGASISSGLARSVILFFDCTFVFGNVSGKIQSQRVVARFTKCVFAATGTVPTILFQTSTGEADVCLIGCDFSALTAGKSLISVTGAGPQTWIFAKSKLNSAATTITGTNPGVVGPTVWLDLCDSADTSYMMRRHQYAGDAYSETTIVRTGGASDGTTSLSHKMVSGATVLFSLPFLGPEMVIWNSAVGSSQTMTCEIVHDSVTALTDAEVWLETEYLGTTGFPLSLFVNDRAADILATPVAQAASTVAWTTTGLTNPNKQKLVTTHTPQEIGYYRCRVALAKPSYTVYVCPKVAVA